MTVIDLAEEVAARKAAERARKQQGRKPVQFWIALAVSVCVVAYVIYQH